MKIQRNDNDLDTLLAALTKEAQGTPSSTGVPPNAAPTTSPTGPSTPSAAANEWQQLSDKLNEAVQLVATIQQKFNMPALDEISKKLTQWAGNAAYMGGH